MTVSLFFQELFKYRNLSHLAHLKTTSYAQHMALNTFYEELTDLIDTLVESYQGKHGLVNILLTGGANVEGIALIKQFVAFLEKERNSIGTDSYLQNQVDEILLLGYQTKYKLENLK